jgi:hypothetical protein
MVSRKVTITTTIYYSKEATIEVEVDETIKDDELVEYLTHNKDIDTLIEDGLGGEELVIDDVKFEYQDPTNGMGGHL